MKNTYVLIVISLVVIALVVGGIYYVLSRSDNGEDIATESSDKEINTDDLTEVPASYTDVNSAEALAYEDSFNWSNHNYSWNKVRDCNKSSVPLQF